MTWRDLKDEDRYEMRIAWGLGGPLGASPIVFVSLPDPDHSETIEKLQRVADFVTRERRKDARISLLQGNCVPAVLLECNTLHLRQRKDGTRPPPPIVRWLAKNLPLELDLPLSRLTLYIVYYGPDKVQVLQETKEFV